MTVVVLKCKSPETKKEVLNTEILKDPFRLYNLLHHEKIKLTNECFEA